MELKLPVTKLLALGNTATLSAVAGSLFDQLYDQPDLWAGADQIGRHHRFMGTRRTKFR